MELSVDIRSEALLARIAGTYERMRGELRSAVTRLSIKVQSSVKEDKLTGQVLHVRTGTLRRSINRVVEEDERGIRATVGTNVEYAAIHEYGFSGTVNVREHVRRTPSGGSATVSAHTREVNLPERSFLRSTLKDFEDEIQETLRAAVLRAVQP